LEGGEIWTGKTQKKKKIQKKTKGVLKNRSKANGQQKNNPPRVQRFHGHKKIPGGTKNTPP